MLFAFVLFVALFCESDYQLSIGVILLGLVLIVVVIDIAEAGAMNPGSEGSRKLSAVSAERERPSKAPWTGFLSNTRRLEDVPVSRR